MKDSTAMKLLNEIIARIKPDLKHGARIKVEINEIVSGINASLKKLNIKATAVIGGSFAKDTHLAEDHDCDIFVQFDYGYKDKNISDLLEKALKQFKPNRLHGSRDYFQFTKSLNYEIVPVLKISKPSQALNVTDFSPLHVAWVKKHKKSDEIRLAKAFCKAHGIYGAESYIKGFSGHVLDILTIHYGSFLNLLKASQKWKSNRGKASLGPSRQKVEIGEKTVIDVEKHYKSPNDALFALNTSKTQNPLIIIDPLQKDRNAAAALSEEKCNLFRQKAKEFLKKPSEKLFEKKIMKKKDFKGAIIMDIIPSQGKRDIVGAKILKAQELLEQELKQHDFEIKDSGWVWDKETFVWFKLKKEKLDATTIVRGPPAKFEKHVLAFRKKHKNTFEKKGIYYAKVRREYTDAKALLKELIKQNEIKEKVKRISL